MEAPPPTAAFSRSAFCGTALRFLLVWSQLAATAPSLIDERDEVCCQGSLIFLKFALSGAGRDGVHADFTNSKPEPNPYRSMDLRREVLGAEQRVCPTNLQLLRRIGTPDARRSAPDRGHHRRLVRAPTSLCMGPVRIRELEAGWRHTG